MTFLPPRETEDMHIKRLEEEIATLKNRILIYKNAYLQLHASVRGAHKGIARLKRKLEKYERTSN